MDIMLPLLAIAARLSTTHRFGARKPCTKLEVFAQWLSGGC